LVGQPALFGVLCGSVTLTGGPATGLAFADQFSAAGIPAAEAVVIAAATIGIVAGSLLGAPLSTILIERQSRRQASMPRPGNTLGSKSAGANIVQAEYTDDGNRAFAIHKSIAALLIAMWIGSLISGWLTAHVMTLPLYIGAMISAAIIRNLDDETGWIGLSIPTLTEIGNVALSFFLVMALMTLDLWRLTDVALPMMFVLALQLAFMLAFSTWPVFARMGRDYEAAVIAGGFYGYMVGTTANALANMESVVERYGPAPLAYLIVPMVGAFFIDFTNALIIQGYLNLLH
jgi:ESS family glutamate:Na+ symporter